ncbi:hypothetical protein [Brevundimonas sp. SORGH_AS_0993]|uniref:hypothetical protein n=1 Tax=Brevundimonas sp. SORGH_AS_0993 TaxID=3041794 RepID=UPI002787BD83|nr:hypothetical protein [Brevundimonas sp. SORGH_AS_0993]MDQ1153059.1 hypothetical protein [Brevundimonas sp. SORGH_AS_0993]
MIEPPKENVDRALWRAVAEAATQFTPVTAALARLYQTTHPSQFQKDVERWHEVVSDTANDHEARLQTLEAAHQPKLKLSPDATALALWLAETSAYGLEDPIGFDAVSAAFPEAAKRDLEDAAAELASFGLVKTSAAFGHPVRLVRPLSNLFALFDPLVKGVSPQDDAAILAAKALELDSGNVPGLMEALGWDARRLNPALMLLMSVIPGPISQEISRDLATRFFAMTPDTRVALKRLRSEP